MDLSVSEIASLVEGKAEGRVDVRLTGIAPLESAHGNDVSFLRNATDKKGLTLYSKTKAGLVLVPNGFSGNGRTVVHVSNPIAALATILRMIDQEKNPSPTGQHPSAVVAADVKVGRNCWIGPCAVIESGAKIGDGAKLEAFVYVGRRSDIGADSHLYPHVTIREDVRVGARCVIHSGAVLGADGYGFYFSAGHHNKIPQVGTVVIEDDVEIGACTTIDRATLGETRIGRGTKIDNLVQVAHNVVIGENSLLVAQTGIAGSTRIGKGVVLGGQVGVADHITIGDGVQVGAQAGVKDDLPPGGTYWGTPAILIADRIKEILVLRRLPALFKRLKMK